MTPEPKLHVLVKEQKAVLIKDLEKKKHKIKCCKDAEFVFGLVYLKGMDNAVNGYSLECENCHKIWARVFEPPESLKLVNKNVSPPETS